MKRGQVFVRALGTNEIWGPHDVMDLTEESFRAWVVDKLIGAEIVASLTDARADGREVPLVSHVPTIKESC